MIDSILCCALLSEYEKLLKVKKKNDSKQNLFVEIWNYRTILSDKVDCICKLRHCIFVVAPLTTNLDNCDCVSTCKQKKKLPLGQYS